MKTHYIKVGVVAAAVALLSGCETTNAIPYKASASNVATIQTTLNDDSNLAVGKVTMSDDVSLLCRLNGDVVVYPGKTIPEYVQDAFLEELIMAQKYNAKASQVNIDLEEVSFSSVTPANWQITANVASSNGESFIVNVKHEFDTSWSAAGACKNVADAFGPTTQALIKEIVNNEKFASLSQ
ncbi:hypothetical protein C9J03_10995 [Photobacterium gaetbulicola]|uniref:Lipoprotein n=1 Tax=Photobacterium gaetbulicola Gung47 TaxID=658445 RepID=A0A0C5WPX2_9GAMM|nr:hypothetical protein [Photobacterium gaetbulicola]AJR08392.1 hypothetical protein H744_2c1726 [Photobacterium gaetbulicola Gung47]PSU12097.1 hypothetical protein C9J03_10995 [Photobacterium gaetbulicola]